MREIMMTGPEPPKGAKFCGVCASLFKQDCLNAVEDEIQAAMRGDAKDGHYWIDLGVIAARHGIELPAVAVVQTLSTVFDGALMESCWSHAKPVRLTRMAVASGGAVPLLGGNGGPGGPRMLPSGLCEAALLDSYPRTEEAGQHV